MKFKNCLSMTLFVCLLTSVFYQKNLIAQENSEISAVEVDDNAVVELLLEDMWNKIDSQSKELLNSSQNSYNTSLDEAFKKNGRLDETEEGKEAINQLSTSFSENLNKYMPESEIIKNKYKSRISASDKRDSEINLIVKEEINSVKSNFYNLSENKNRKISSEVIKVRKKFVENLVSKIIETRNKGNEKLKTYVSEKVEKEKEYYNKKMSELYNKCVSNINSNAHILSNQKIQEFLSECNKSKRELQKMIEDLSKLSETQNEEIDVKKTVEKDIYDLKKDKFNITYKEIKENLLNKYEKLSNDSIKQLQDEINTSLKNLRDQFDNAIKGAEDKSNEIFKDILKMIKQKEIEDKMTEEEKKQKAEAERLQKEIDAFLEESKNMIMDDDKVLKNMITCDYKEVTYNEGGNVEYCSKWVLGYSAEKIYKSTAKKTKDLDPKLICKTKEKLNLNYNKLPKNGSFIDKKVNNISDKYLAKIEIKTEYTCPADYKYIGDAKCQKVYGFTCNDRTCMAWNPQAWCTGCVRGCGWFCLYWKSCCHWWGIHQEGHECREKGYNYVSKIGLGLAGNIILGFLTFGASEIVDHEVNGNGRCVKTETISATPKTTYLYYVNNCSPSVKNNISIEDAYDPNLTSFTGR